jgi:glycosyltransferase involved in cell wall biosynthesis
MRRRTVASVPVSLVSVPRRVGLNALFLDPGVSGGSETYLRGLVPALVSAFPDVRFDVATTRRGESALAREQWADTVELLRLPCDDDEPVRRTLYEQVWLPRLAARRGWDLLHSLSNRGPRWAPTATVVTVHDVIFFRHRTMGVVSTHGMRWAVKTAIAGADEIIAVSEAMADEIASVLAVERSRITAVPHGPGRPPGGPAHADVARHRYGLSGVRVVLCVAAKRPHKNQRLLVEALRRLPDDVHLVLVGHDEGYGRELRETVEALGMAARVRLLDYVSEPELESLWAVADCAAFPTKAEGFGLPVLEAMQRGVPVACSDIPALREVADSAVHFFDPEDSAGAAAAIEAALAQHDVTAGRERARSFTWERAAHETFAVYERAAGRRRCESA